VFGVTDQNSTALADNPCDMEFTRIWNLFEMRVNQSKSCVEVLDDVTIPKQFSKNFVFLIRFIGIDANAIRVVIT